MTDSTDPDVDRPTESESTVEEPADDEPIVQCTLTDPEARERIEWVEAELVEDLVAVEELADGYRFQFDGTDDTLQAVATFVTLESTCCSFAHFAIEVPPASSTTILTVTGPEGTKALGQAGGLFDLDAVPEPT